MSVYAPLLLSLILRLTKGNYLCVCNYNVEQGVLPFPDPQAKPMGYMYEFDCKSVVQQADLNTEQWHAIAYRGQIAYLQVNSNIQETMCSGFIPKFDQITTTKPRPHVASIKPIPHSGFNSMRTTTIQPALNSQRSPVAINALSTTNPMMQNLTTKTSTYFTKNVSSIFTAIQSSQVISNRSVTMVAGMSISNEQTTLINVLGLSQVTSMSNLSNTSNSGITFKAQFNKTSQQSTTILAMSSPLTRATTTRSTSVSSQTTITTTTRKTTMTSSTKSTRTTHSTTSPTTTTIPTTYSPTVPSVKGDITLCPTKLLQYTKEDNGALTQYGNKCYELVPFKLIWTKAELDCQAKGGHLLTVQTETFKDYIYTWIRGFANIPAVWLGISDRRGNGWFDWTSGEQLVSTFWVEESFVDHFDNCGIMLLDETSKGGWKPVTCGKTTATGDQGSQYSFICEYPIMPHSLSAGAIGR